MRNQYPQRNPYFVREQISNTSEDLPEDVEGTQKEQPVLIQRPNVSKPKINTLK